MYDVTTFRFDYYHTWNFIIGVQYVSVGSYGYTYGDILDELSRELGEEFKKPVVLLNQNTMRAAEYNRIQALDILDYEYGV